jgi:hypothetical protein
MTTSITSAPEQTSVTPGTDKHAVLALCAALFGPEHGSNLLSRALTASILADRYGVSPGKAIDWAMTGRDSHVREAGRECDRLIDQARRAVLAAEQDGEVA